MLPGFSGFYRLRLAGRSCIRESEEKLSHSSFESSGWPLRADSVSVSTRHFLEPNGSEVRRRFHPFDGSP